MKVTTHHSERRVNYVREDCTAERGSHHKQPKELVRRSAKMPNIFLHAEADEPIQTAALLGHLWLGLVRVCYVVKNSKNNHLKIFLFVVRADCTGISKKANKKAGWARLHFRRSPPHIKVLLTRTILRNFLYVKKGESLRTLPHIARRFPNRDSENQAMR